MTDWAWGNTRRPSWRAEFRQFGQQATNGDPVARPRYTAAVVACVNQAGGAQLLPVRGGVALLVAMRCIRVQLIRVRWC